MNGIVSMRNLGCSLLLWFGATTTLAAEEFDRVVAPFFKAHCVKCHGPEKQKGKVTLHNVDGGLAAGKSLERWELILEVLESGEMPPEEETERPDAAAVAKDTGCDSSMRIIASGSALMKLGSQADIAAGTRVST